MEWFYYDESGEKIGPFNVSQIRELVKQRVIKRDTIIENTGGRKMKAGEVNGLNFPPEPVVVPVAPVVVPVDTDILANPFSRKTSSYVPSFEPRKYPNIDKGITLLRIFYRILFAINILICIGIFIGSIIMTMKNDPNVPAMFMIDTAISVVYFFIAWIIYIFQMLSVELIILMTHIAQDVHVTRWIAEQEQKKPK